MFALGERGLLLQAHLKTRDLQDPAQGAVWKPADMTEGLFPPEGLQVFRKR